jgi:hypothetical protein
MVVQVIGSVYEGRGREGDFAWMIRQPHHDRALFIFNDNEEQFRAHRDDPCGGAGCSEGGGNAVIRPYQCTDPPRAAGIPTGSRGRGYSALTAGVQEVIDDALFVIGGLRASGRYDRAYYSAADDRGSLGTGIFQVADEVKEYITAGLLRLGPEPG